MRGHGGGNRNVFVFKSQPSVIYHRTAQSESISHKRRKSEGLRVSTILLFASHTDWAAECFLCLSIGMKRAFSANYRQLNCYFMCLFFQFGFFSSSITIISLLIEISATVLFAIAYSSRFDSIIRGIKHSSLLCHPSARE